jgi:hypothetical protein
VKRQKTRPHVARDSRRVAQERLPYPIPASFRLFDYWNQSCGLWLSLPSIKRKQQGSLYPKKRLLFFGFSANPPFHDNGLHEILWLSRGSLRYQAGF